jgi:hypothetical protein
MNVSAVSSPVQPFLARPPTDAAESWGTDNDGDADDTALTVKSFAGQPAAEPAAQPAGQPATGGALYA